MRYAGSPSKTAENSSQCLTPAESVSKWKIPHYYRKSTGAPVRQELGSNTSLKSESNRANGNINIMTTPKHVQLDESGGGSKRGSKSKAKKGEMVFVNYTVKDAKSADAPLPKKKSSKSRMLKLFSSGHNSGMDESFDNFSQLDVSTPQDSSDAVQKSRSSGSTPSSQATKRSYSSFLKYGHAGSSSTITSPAITPPGDGVSSTSLPLRSTVQRPSLGPSLSSNVSLVNNNGKASLALGTNDPASNFYHSPSKEKSNLNEAPRSDLHYNDQYNDRQGHLATFRPQLNHMHTSAYPKSGDENDASIAFSKMFTRKRANTGGSMSSLVSSTASNNLPTLHRNMSTHSISSMSNRYSPIRAGSPARNNSILRSNSNRYSRDCTLLQGSSNYADLTGGMEIYLDSQTKQRHTTHKKKQDSISDSYRALPNNTALGPYPSTVSSLSSASTPCLVEGGTITNTSGVDRQNSIILSLDRESSLENEILEEQEETANSPNGRPAIQGIPKTTLEVGERELDNISLPNTSRSSVTMFSSLVNSHSTLDSSFPPTKDFESQRMHDSGNFQHFNSDIQNKDSLSSMNFNSAQNDDFLNLYMELDIGSRAEMMTDQFERPNRTENDMSVNSAPMQGDMSTLNSMLNASPATITNTNVPSARQNQQQDTTYNEPPPYTNFSHRIMHDIDQIAHSINATENTDEAANEWN